ncbi:D-2-hydroxyacid dehydrogenase family protein [Zhihengliuella halotolerans]|uniref:Lactate dehydrogenase-like 2-hydroxyacid dehydrogenase n=1 Tax=Zhihengliuella halotolerans TaxID=370736 RepID=A0A4Q8AGI9_9MICC|nr:D-2-hydroxyacid dehydrogenase family protein [Zhihengliuella halotolerans]RZU62865.1 lactate dehydrogenase-like 2-hydroxyacid dehydrogenase [Zhihengliuella halotolerans]
MTRKLALLDDYQDVARDVAAWDDLDGWEVHSFRRHLRGRELTAALTGFTAAVAMRERTAFDREVLERLPDLELLVTTGARNASIDIAAATDLGVTVCGTDSSPAAAPELTWALLMAAVRDIPGQQAALRAGRWQTGVGGELAGRTLGLLGLGKIGTRVAGYGRAFGMDVIAWSENLTAERAAAAGARRVGKQELFAESDVVAITTRLSERTRGIVGRAELEALGPDGLLVNTSRAGIVDTDALLEALHDGGLGGAALDVFDVEPLPLGHPLLEAPRTLLTPHLGYVTREQYRVFYRDALEDVRAWTAGAPLRVVT